MANPSPFQALILIVIIHQICYLNPISFYLIKQKKTRETVLGIFYHYSKSAEVLLMLIRYFPLNGNMGNGSDA